MKRSYLHGGSRGPRLSPAFPGPNHSWNPRLPLMKVMQLSLVSKESHRRFCLNLAFLVTPGGSLFVFSGDVMRR